MEVNPELAMQTLDWAMKTVSSVLLPIYLFHRNQDKKARVSASEERDEIKESIHKIELLLAESKGKNEFVEKQAELVPKLKYDVDNLGHLYRGIKREN